MSVTDELIRNAEAYAASFDKGELPLPPARKIAIVACMDARLLPARLLGVEEGGALDALTREQMQVELHRIWRASGRTAVFITHSVEEASPITSAAPWPE